MKSKLSKLSILIGFALICAHVHAQNPLLDLSVDVNDIGVKNSTGATAKLGSSLSHFTTIFGAPDSTTTEYWETSDDTPRVCHYGQSRFDFVHNKLVSYKVKSSSFRIGKTNAGFDILIGNNINKLSRLFPNTSTISGPGFLVGALSQNGNRLDDYISFSFNSGKSITEISIGTP